MLTAMTEDDWAIVLQVFRAVRSRRGDKGRDDRKFLEALLIFGPHHLARPFGGVRPLEFDMETLLAAEPSWHLEAFFDALAALSESAHLVQMFNSTVARAHVSAAGAKGGQTIRRSAVRVAASQPKSTSSRPRRLAARLLSDRGRRQRQPQLRTPARHRT